jgi:hypothetical protein
LTLDDMLDLIKEKARDYDWHIASTNVIRARRLGTGEATPYTFCPIDVAMGKEGSYSYNVMKNVGLPIHDAHSIAKAADATLNYDRDIRDKLLKITGLNEI